MARSTAPLAPIAQSLRRDLARLKFQLVDISANLKRASNELYPEAWRKLMSANSEAIDAVTAQLTTLTSTAPGEITAAIAAANAAGVETGTAAGDPDIAASIGNLQAAANTLSSAVAAVLPPPAAPAAPAA